MMGRCEVFSGEKPGCADVSGVAVDLLGGLWPLGAGMRRGM